MLCPENPVFHFPTADLSRAHFPTASNRILRGKSRFSQALFSALVNDSGYGDFGVAELYPLRDAPALQKLDSAGFERKARRTLCKRKKRKNLQISPLPSSLSPPHTLSLSLFSPSSHSLTH